VAVAATGTGPSTPWPARTLTRAGQPVSRAEEHEVSIRLLSGAHPGVRTVSPTLHEALLIVCLILLNGFLSMSEIAVVSARKGRLRQWAAEGRRGAGLALELARDPGRFLATIQVGITLVGILSGAFGGVTLAQKVADFLAGWPALAPHSQTLGVGIVVLAITYASLVAGELVPKAVGLNAGETIAAAVAGPMRLVSRGLAPVVWLLDASTRAVLWLLRVRRASEPPVTDDELRYIVREGTEAGVFAPQEETLIEGVLRLGERKVASLMTPRHELVCLYLDDRPQDVREKVLGSLHSRFPLCGASTDDVRGTVRTKDILGAIANFSEPDLEALAQPPLFVPESLAALSVLDSFRETGVHMAIVVDEYGMTQGVVTVDEVLQAVAGELAPPDSRELEDVTVRQDGSWLVEGGAPLEVLTEDLGCAELPERHGTHYHTLGGFAMDQLGRVPATGDVFEWQGLAFEVVDMDGYRVDKLLVRRAESDAD